jgi:hypothetical protein
MNVDGFGNPANKISKYNAFHARGQALPRRLQALLPRGHRPDEAAPRPGDETAPDLVVYE